MENQKVTTIIVNHRENSSHRGSEESPEKFTALLRRVAEGGFSSKNIVGMNEKDVTRLFPHHEKDSRVYIRIADRVYQVIVQEWLNPGQLAVNDTQVNEIGLAINSDDTVIITPFEPDVMNHRIAERLTFSIRPNQTYAEEELENSDLILLSDDRLKKLVSKNFKNQFFRLGQQIRIDHDGVDFLLTCTRGKGTISPPSDDFFEYLNGKTKILFEENVWNPYCIIEKKRTINPLTFYFQIEVNGDDDFPTDNRPILYDVEKLSKIVRSKFKNQYMIPGRKCQFSIAPRVTVEAKLDFIDPIHVDIPIKEQPGIYAPAYKIEKDSQLEFTTDNEVLCAVKGDPIPVKFAYFLIKSTNTTPSYDGLDDKIKNWVNIKELAKVIKKEIPVFCAETEFYVEYEGLVYYLIVVGADNYNFIERDNTNMKHWAITDETVVEVIAGSKVQKELIKNEKVHPLESIELEINQNPHKKCRDVICVDKEKVLKAVREFKPIERCPKQMFTIRLDNGQSFEIKVTNLKYKNNKLKGRIYSSLGKIVSDTEINLKIRPRSHIQLISEPKILKFKNGDPRSSLEEIGLTGLDDTIIEAVEMLVYPMGELREWAQKIGIKPQKGLLLYGPPGTGKTTFAHGLAKLLGISKGNLKEISAKDIHSRWVGESEKKIHKLFEPAIEAARTEEGKRERFMIFIDEIESLCANREEETSSYKKDIVGALLAEMDGFNKLENVIVLGTTNDFKRIDPAFLRPGRFSNLLEFPLPDEKGRQKILEFHTRELRENDLIDEDVDLTHYAVEMEGLSGDHLRGFVIDAKLYNLRRLTKMGIRETEVNDYPEAKISREDFENAFQKLKRIKQNDSSLPAHMYS